MRFFRGVASNMGVSVDKISRSKRKTILITVTGDARLIVHAPYYTTDEEIDQVIEQKMQWIQEKVTDARRRLAEYPTRLYQGGEEFPFLGGHLILCYTSYSKKVYSDGKKLFVPVMECSHARKVIIDWYKIQAENYIKGRTEELAGRLGLTYRQLTITGALKRWGSCGSGKTLNFSWRLILAPGFAIDYVIVHELAHLLHMDHSTKFWTYVAGVMPDYRQRMEWLKNHGGIMRDDLF